MTFKIYTLGCKVNAYESSVMQEQLIKAGYKLTDEKSDITIINTCTVTNTADSKSRKMINRARKENEKTILVVTGCMTQNNQEKLENVDIVIGNIGKSKIVDYIQTYLKNKQEIFDLKDISHTHFESMILNNFDKTRAFVKIQDGCNNFCSYCIIPYTRGNVRSKDPKDILKEIKFLIENGHKEIVLTGIHTGHYGEDKDYKLKNLLIDILKIKGLERLRISSIEITELDDEFLKVLKENPILVDHMHIPLQSGSDAVLKRMNRKYDKEYFIKKIEKIRSIRPNISITTDVITGFPGETIEEAKETIDTINKIKFSKIHVFPFSRRKGTKADLMENQIDDKTKKERVKELLELSKKLEEEYFNKFIGKEVVFIPEVYKNGFLIGHTGNYLLVKTKGKEEDKYRDIKVTLEKVEYPYIIGG